MQRILCIIAVFAALLFSPRAGMAQSPTTIDLRTTVTLPTGSPVLLKDLATVGGPDADRLGTVVILHADEAKATESDATRVLSRDTLRAAIDHAAPNWSRTLLRGGTITITFTPPASPAVSAAGSPTALNSIAPAPASPVTAGASPAPGTDPRSLRAMLLRTLAEAAGAGIDTTEVSLRTDGLPPSDQQLLAAPVPLSWKCHIQVLGATPSGRTPVKIEAFDGDRVALSKTITVEALVQREVLVVAAAGGVARDQIIAAADLRLDSRALTITDSARLASVTTDQVVGSAARRRIDLGKPILPSDVVIAKAAIVVHRGDDVQVSCLSGGMILKTKAKSLAVARDGEMVQLQIDGSKKVITARMNGMGKAVINLDAAGN